MSDGEEDEGRTGREELARIVCDHVHGVFFLLVFCVILLFLTGLSLLFGQPGTASYTLALINLGFLVPFFFLLSAIFYRCTA